MKKGCKKCKQVFENLEVCPECGEKLTQSWKGLLIVVDPEQSEIAKKLNIKKEGKYA
ncbi:MAG: transcription elongation factor subunit Spt4, partial [Candidatus Pacearchaeota archaeon]